jgi:hypothetical protein
LIRLEAATTTASLQLEGNQLEYLQTSYDKENAIETNYQDRIYQLLYEALLEIK